MRQIGHRTAAMMLGACAAVLLGGDMAGAQTRLSIATGSPGGVVFPFGVGLAEVVNDHLQDVRITAESTAGSQQNARLIGTGQSDLGLFSADVAYYAQTGTGVFEGEQVPGLRGLAITYGNIMHVLTRADSEVKAIPDLAGRLISVGPAGSGTAFLSGLLLDAYGIADEVQLSYLTHDQESSALGDGRIAAAFYLVGTPSAAVTSFMAAHDARFLPVSEEVRAKLTEEYPFYQEVVVPGGIYPGQEEDVPTIGLGVLLATHADMPDDLAYRITKTVLEHAQEIAQYHAVAEQIDFETALRGMPIPLHPGAERYYRENDHPELDK